MEPVLTVEQFVKMWSKCGAGLYDGPNVFVHFTCWEDVVLMPGQTTQSLASTEELWPNWYDHLDQVIYHCTSSDQWEVFAKLDNGYYMFLEAWCDYTGFGCRGGVKAYVDKDPRFLYNMACTDAQRVTISSYLDLSSI